MKKNNCDLIYAYLKELFPNAKCELEYGNDYQLLIAIILSAQCTDARVNIVTKKLFAKYTSLSALNEATLTDIENEIKSLGLYKNKAKAIKEVVSILLTKYNGVVPSNKSDLLTLPGVGNKTANVFRAEYYKEPEIAVDTHVTRVSKRLGIATKNDSVSKIEAKLRKLFKEEQYIEVHHMFIHFGRYFCKAIKPNCSECKLKAICKSNKSKLVSDR